jgi:hypothetical protein
MESPDEKPTPENTVHIEPVYNESVPDSATLSAPVDAPAPPGVSISDISAPFKLDMGDSAQTVPLNRDGTPKRKPGRPRKDAAQISPALGDTAQTPATQPAKSPAAKKANRVAADELARAILNLSVGGMSAMVGPEWQFQSPEEAQGMKAAVAAYIEAKGDGQLSPEALLALVVASYAVPRFAEENTRTKLGGFFGKIWDGFKGLWRR